MSTEHTEFNEPARVAKPYLDGYLDEVDNPTEFTLFNPEHTDDRLQTCWITCDLDTVIPQEDWQ